MIKTYLQDQAKLQQHYDEDIRRAPFLREDLLVKIKYFDIPIEVTDEVLLAMFPEAPDLFQTALAASQCRPAPKMEEQVRRFCRENNLEYRSSQGVAGYERRHCFRKMPKEATTESEMNKTTDKMIKELGPLPEVPAGWFDRICAGCAQPMNPEQGICDDRKRWWHMSCARSMLAAFGMAQLDPIEHITHLESASISGIPGNAPIKTLKYNCGCERIGVGVMVGVIPTHSGNFCYLWSKVCGSHDEQVPVALRWTEKHLAGFPREVSNGV